jgi:hypothetical protein
MMKAFIAGAALLLAAMAVAGCSGKSAQEAAVEPNAVPANYKIQLAVYLNEQLDDRADFQGAFIGAPTLKPVGDSQRIVVCLQFNGHNMHKDKVAVFFAGTLTQFVDAKPQQCADATYEPFRELAAMTPPK